MSLTDEQVSATAKALVDAESSGQQIGLLSQVFPELDMNDAYRIQSGILNHKLSAGRQVIGWKIGLTSKAMQQALSIDIPDSGILFDDMAFDSDSTVAVVSSGRCSCRPDSDCCWQQ